MNAPTNTLAEEAAESSPAASPCVVGQPVAAVRQRRRPRTVGRVARWLAFRIGIYFSLYVASIGPMFWYWYEAKHLGGMEAIYAFYYPLMLLCEIEWIRDLVNAYIRFWIL